MKAIAIENYGSAEVLKYVNIDRPPITPDRMLIKVMASSVNPIDWKIRKGMLQILTGYNFPMQLGFDVAGEVIEVGEKVSKFKTGDAIYAYLDSLPGSAYAEYVTVTEKVTCLKPNNLNYREAAVIPLAATTALQALRDKGKIEKGQKVLINGASGGVGTFAVQIAKAYQTEVTAVCSRRNIELVKNLGADRVIDYQQQDFTQDKTKYHIILDAVSNRSFSECDNSLLPQGIYITLLPSLEILLQSFLNLIRDKKAELFFAKANSEDLAYLKNLIETDRIKPIIDRTYPLSEIIAAHNYSETQRATGKIAIDISQS